MYLQTNITTQIRKPLKPTSHNVVKTSIYLSLFTTWYGSTGKQIRNKQEYD